MFIRKVKTDYQSCQAAFCDKVTNPYTLFYEGIFRNKQHENLNIAELGILESDSLLMWRDYFPNSQIHGFAFNHDLIPTYQKNVNNDRISLAPIDMTNTINPFGVLYDIIIEDTKHEFKDQIRVIANTYKWVKPGGVLIIQNIFKKYTETDYIRELTHFLHHFQDYYFVELDHDKILLILVKDGAKPIFQNNKITIITPSYRLKNLVNLKQSILFDFVDEWIIVYDGTKIKQNPNLFQEKEKIKEFVYEGEGISGNPQRNFALTKVSNPNTLLYFLDDDNIIHPNLYRLLTFADNTKFYTFNQVNRLKGNVVKVTKIDTAMALIPFQRCNEIRWRPNLYEADGYYLVDCINQCGENHVFVDNDMCYYNKLCV